MTKQVTIALAGNPNAGKTTIFNALTGSNQHVGNWPGKTVEKKEGVCRLNGHLINVVDLPGSYSLTAHSPDEIIARDFIVRDKPDVVVAVVDATNLERNLYLTLQIMELGAPLVVALNMSDQARAAGLDIDHERLSQLLGGAPVVATAATRGEGIERLLAATAALANGRETVPASASRPFQIDYGLEVEAEIKRLAAAIARSALPLNGYTPRWLALKLLEGEPDLVETIGQKEGGAALVELARERARHLASIFGDDVDMITAGQRYGYINGLSRQVARRSALDRISMTERIDNVVTNRLVGLPIFLAIMYIVFRLVIDVSAPYLEWVEAVIAGPISRWIELFLTAVAAPAWLESMVIDGVVAGVGGILVFVPGLIVLYFFLALLEDSGYMARAAFVMDRFMRLVGLHGKSVIPLLLGFGCAVPAIYATRTISSFRDRLLTALLVPLMSCSARLPVYVVFGLAFFGARAGTVVWLLYLLGIAVALVVGFLFARTLLKPESNAAFILELPPYRMPTLKSLWRYTWRNTREFVHKAGTVILAGSMVIWLLLNLPWGVASQRDSYYGQASAAVAPIFQPMGFGQWEAAGALTTGFIAKEMVVSAMAQIYLGGEWEAGESDAPASFGEELGQIVVGFGEATMAAGLTFVSLAPGVDLVGEEEIIEDRGLSAALRQHFSPLAAFAFLVFVLLYVPCVATIGAIKQEFGWRWAITAAVYQTSVAWLVAFLVYQVGTLIT